MLPLSFDSAIDPRFRTTASVFVPYRALHVIFHNVAAEVVSEIHRLDTVDTVAAGMADRGRIPVALRDAIEHQQTVPQILVGVVAVVEVQMEVVVAAVLLLFGIYHNKKVLLITTPHCPNTMMNYVCNITAMCLIVFCILYFVFCILYFVFFIFYFLFFIFYFLFCIFYFLLVQQTHNPYRADTSMW